MPRGRAASAEDTADGQIPTLAFESTTSPARMQELVQAVYASELPDHVIAELNFARFLQGMAADLLRDATNVVRSIEDYLDETA